MCSALLVLLGRAEKALGMKCHLLQTSLKSHVLMKRYKMQCWIMKM